RTELIADPESRKCKQFLSLYFDMAKIGVDSKDLKSLFDTTIQRSFSLILPNDTLNASYSLQDYLFQYIRIIDAKLHGFVDEYRNVSRAKLISDWYYLAKSSASGLVREKLLAYILTSWGIKRAGFE